MTTATKKPDKLAVMPPTTARFQKKLRAALDAAAMSQTALAESISDADWTVTPQLIHHYLRGSATPKPDTLARIAKALGVDLQWLCDESIESLEPVRRDQSRAVDELDNEELMGEVMTRIGRIGDELVKRLNWAEAQGHRWEHNAIGILWGADNALNDPYCQRMMREAVAMLNLDQDLSDFDAVEYGSPKHFVSVPGSGIFSEHHAAVRKARKRYDKLCEEHPGILAMQSLEDFAKDKTLEVEYDPEYLEEQRFRDLAELLIESNLPDSPVYKSMIEELQSQGWISSDMRFQPRYRPAEEETLSDEEREANVRWWQDHDDPKWIGGSKDDPMRPIDEDTQGSDE